MLSRGEKVGETKQSLEQFKQSEEHGADQSIGEIAAQADFVVDNNGTLEAYQLQLKEIAEKICS